MQVKVFEAKDMASGLKMVKEALGPDALILSTRTVRNGPFGVLGKPMLEITAAIDTAWKEPKEHSLNARRSMRASISCRTKNKDENILPGNTPDFRQGPAALNPDLHQELTELSATVKNLSSQIKKLSSSPLRKPYVEPEFVVPGEKSLDINPVSAFLMGYGINMETARMLARFTRDTIEQSHHLDAIELCAILKAAMARLFITKKYLEPNSGKQRCISLIGPTGVGKTTTLAKMAAHYLTRFGGRIALITIDTYRIAAVEQLKVYGEIMRLPVEVIIKPSDLDQALKKFRDYDLILIDTAGHSPKNSFELQELAAVLQPHPEIENNLLLSASTREQEIEETIRCFSILPITTFLFSKIDECNNLGVLLNIHYKNDKPISFLTNGQKVPEDLLTPSPADIANLIMNEHRTLNHG